MTETSPESGVAPEPAPEAAHPPVDILWRDESAAIVCKPSGMLSHNSKFAGPREYALLQAARDTLGAKVWLANRLDRGTSGCIVVCFSPSDLAPWVAALQAGDKQYLAITRGRMHQAVTIDKALRDDGGVERPAKTDFTPLALSTVERASLVRCDLTHGRIHQARRHLNRANHPVANDANHGDTRYNRAFRERWGVTRLLLHAERLSFDHPTTGQPLSISCEPPSQMQGLINQLFFEDA
ncbi:MAG: hypothetical protein KC502_06010 [Myxococcales bacterium]|nr:hypothetical protein [Myxococcales bacterium]